MKRLSLILVFALVAGAVFSLPGYAANIAAIENATAVEPLKAPESVGLEEAKEPQETKEEAVEAAFLDMFFWRPRALGAVEKQLSLFSQRIKERFALYLSRSGRYLGLMQGILAEKGLPEDLAWLPLIESGFSTQAKSRMKAVGPWQFIESTGRLYGLKINWWVDERRDPVKSTLAAADYLDNLYKMFGSWSLSLAAYNAGEGRVLRALRKSKGNDYWDIQKTRYLKPETKDYVPKFIAAKLIADEPEKYGFSDIEYQEVFAFDEARVPGGVPLEAVANATGAALEIIRDLNPEIIRSCTPPDEKEYLIRIPSGTRAALIANSLEPSKECTYKPRTYVVKRGDTLTRIAKKTGVPLKEVTRLNSLKKKSKLRVGQVLYLTPKRG